MSVWKEIRCDAKMDDCFSNRNEGPMGFEGVAELHAQARKQGWLVAGGQAICPNCRPTEQPPA